MSEIKTSIGIPSGWTLSQQEVSNGVYNVRLTAYFGSTVEMTGTEIDELLASCIESAKSIDKQLGQL
jgi:hypothetical protein